MLRRNPDPAARVGPDGRPTRRTLFGPGRRQLLLRLALAVFVCALGQYTRPSHAWALEPYRYSEAEIAAEKIKCEHLVQYSCNIVATYYLEQNPNTDLAWQYLLKSCYDMNVGIDCGVLADELAKAQPTHEDERSIEALMLRACDLAGGYSCLRLADRITRGQGLSLTAADAQHFYSKACGDGFDEACRAMRPAEMAPPRAGVRASPPPAPSRPPPPAKPAPSASDPYPAPGLAPLVAAQSSKASKEDQQEAVKHAGELRACAQGNDDACYQYALWAGTGRPQDMWMFADPGALPIMVRLCAGHRDGGYTPYCHAEENVRDILARGGHAVLPQPQHEDPFDHCLVRTDGTSYQVRLSDIGGVPATGLGSHLETRYRDALKNDCEFTLRFEVKDGDEDWSPVELEPNERVDGRGYRNVARAR